MFSSFVTFTEVVKLSPIIYHNQETINYSDTVIKAIVSKDDIQSALSIIDKVENRSLIIKFADIDEKRSGYHTLIKKIFAEKDTDTRKIHGHLFLLSCKENDLEMVKTLLTGKYTIDIIDGLTYAVETNNLELLKFFVSNNFQKVEEVMIKEDHYILQKAINKCNIEIIKFIIIRRNIIHRFFCLGEIIKKDRADILTFFEESRLCKRNYFPFAKEYLKEIKSVKVLDFIVKNSHYVNIDYMIQNCMQMFLEVAVKLNANNTIQYLLDNNVKVYDYILNRANCESTYNLLKQHKS